MLTCLQMANYGLQELVAFVFFSCSTNNMESNEAKVLEIWKPMLMSIDWCYVSTNQWVVEFDSYNAITWIKMENIIRPWCL
jgi:hypothetical protein